VAASAAGAAPRAALKATLAAIRGRRDLEVEDTAADSTDAPARRATESAGRTLGLGRAAERDPFDIAPETFAGPAGFNSVSPG